MWVSHYWIDETVFLRIPVGEFEKDLFPYKHLLLVSLCRPVLRERNQRVHQMMTKNRINGSTNLYLDRFCRNFLPLYVSQRNEVFSLKVYTLAGSVYGGSVGFRERVG